MRIGTKKKEPYIHEGQVCVALMDIKRYLGEGYSITYARKVACGFDSSHLCKKVMVHPYYLILLNDYMKTKPQKTKYKIKNGCLIIDRG